MIPFLCVCSFSGDIFDVPQNLEQPASFFPTTWNVLSTYDGLTVDPFLCRSLATWWTQICSAVGTLVVGQKRREVIRYAHKTNRDRFKWEFFHASEVYPVRNSSFAGAHLEHQVAGPANPMPYINRVYGSWIWGQIPGIIPTGQSGVAFGQTWAKKSFWWQHHFGKR